MKKTLNAAVSLIALLTAATAVAGRDLDCSVAKGATINGIRTLRYIKEDHRGSGTLTIGREGKNSERHSVTNGSDLFWGESQVQPRGTNYSVEDTISLRKSRSDNGEVSFALVKVRRTLSGANCDGYHVCEVQTEVVRSIPLSCVDSDDAPKAPSEPHRCDPDLPGDCE